MKLLFTFFIFMTNFESVLAYDCYQNINVSSSVPSITIFSPKEDGDFMIGPVNCTTTVIFEEPSINGFLPGANITIAQCSNLSNENTVAINNQAFQHCPPAEYSIKITDTNIIKFDFFIETKTFIAVLQPVPQTTSYTCLCYPDQNENSSTSFGTTIKGPSVSGLFGSFPCSPINCSTIVTFGGSFMNNRPAGARITMLTCDGLTSNNSYNHLNVITDNQNISLVCGISSFEFANTSIFKFHFQIKTDINILIVVEPIQPPMTTPLTSSKKPTEATPLTSSKIPNSSWLTTTTIASSTTHFTATMSSSKIQNSSWPTTTSSISSTTNSNATTPSSKTIKNSVKWWWIVSGVILLLLGITIFVLIFRFIKRRYVNHRQKNLQIEMMQEKFEMSPLERQLSRDIRSRMHLNNKNLHVYFNDLIGRCSNAFVYKAYIKGETCLYAIHKSIETSHYVDCEAAVKIPKNFESDDTEEFVRELDALITISYHPHIIALFGWSMHQSVPCLVTELADCDLLTYIRSLRNEDLPLLNLLSILWQITQALEFVASFQMVHRDVACRNILLMNNRMAKLSDFGLCCHCDESLTYTASMQKRLPLKWLSIEALVDRIFSEKSDVWSFGILCYEIFSYGAIPYPTLSNNEMLEFIQAGRRLEKPINTSEEIYEIMLNCWNEQPQKRPTFKELRQKFKTILEAESITDGYLLLNN